MITYKDILFSTTKILSDSFDIDVIVKNEEGTFNNECFYVTLVPISSSIYTSKVNEKQLILSIKYFCGDKLKNYDIANKLESLFTRNIKVKDNFLNISNIEPNFIVDEVGDMLDFLVYLSYFDKIDIPLEEFENMENINFKTTSEGGVIEWDYQ